jgi:hypothetical protein
MNDTLYLNPTTWDLDIDADGNLAVATGRYALAQDAACAIRTFLGECWLDKTVGVPYMTEILGHSPSLDLVKARLAAAAMTVDGVTSATVVITSTANRTVTGQVQITDTGGAVAVANF